MTKRYRHFLYYDTKFSFGSFSKFKQILCLLRAGLVYSRSNPVSKYLTILFLECSLSLNLTVFVTASDIHGFLTLSSQLQIHENATEIGLNLKQNFKGAKYLIVFGYLTGYLSCVSWISLLRISLDGQISYNGYYQESDLPHILISFLYNHIFISQQLSTFT